MREALGVVFCSFLVCRGVISGMYVLYCRL